MRLALSAIFIGSAVAFDNIFSFNGTEDYDAADAAWEEENCVMFCDQSQCVLKEQKCNGKRDCIDGADEQGCQIDDSRDGTGHSDVKSKNRRPTPPPTPSPFRGRFPSFYAPQASAFRGFNDQAFSVFQRRNRRILQHVTGKQNDERFEQMMKMMFYMTDGKLSIANYMSYGCHCSVDGSGHGFSNDEIDSACSRNAGCRKCATSDFSCSQDTQYLVNGAISGRPDGLACINRPDTCARALCECDLQMVRDFISNQKMWNQKFHTFHGFDKADCSTSGFSSNDLGRSLQSTSGSKPSSDGQCCGNYPNRQPINGSNRGCCGEKTFSSDHFECCLNSEIVPIGSC